MTTIKGNLVMDKDMEYEGDLIVKGNILGKNGNRYNLKVHGNITAWDIDAWDISAWNITAGNINAGNITAKNITAKNITAGNLDVGDIDAWDISAWNITAKNITAGNLDVGDIDARNIDAGNISYYAVCFAYKNIKCKSIKGTRNNAKHFVLDGKIEVVE